MLDPQAAHADGTAPGTTINNVGTVSYDAYGASQLVQSNVTATTVEAAPSRSTISIERFDPGTSAAGVAGPTQCRAAGGFAPLPAPALASGKALDATQPLPLTDTANVHGDDPLFVRVTDADQNHDATLIDTVDVRVVARSTGDSEVIRLSETGPNTGVFVGYLPTRVAAAVAGDCVLEVARDSSLEVQYSDPQDSADTASASATIDPFGRVFDSQDGHPVSGARVRLIDAVTGAAASVFGDDGVSAYPAELVTGQPITDSGGTTYSLPAGVYRFPVVAPGLYRLAVTPPAGFVAPSTVPVTALQQLAGAPFRLSDGSFLKPFMVAAPVAAVTDVPLDPTGTSLSLTKTASTELAAPGDFVQYTLVLQNASPSGAFTAVQTSDRLPVGVRYREGSTRVAQQPAADPQITPDGRTLTFTTPRLQSGASLTISYVTEVTVGAKEREMVNTAQAVAAGGVTSNPAQALVRLKNELFSDHGFLVGRVFEGECSAAAGAPGVAGVRVYLEDGRYAIADEGGRFHFEDVLPGTHVVQLDTDTLPAHLELAPCANDVRHSGRAYSQFVDLRAGALWRTDFALQEKAPPTGSLRFEFHSQLFSAGEVEHVAVISAQSVPVGKLRVLAMLPDGLEYVADSAIVQGSPVSGATVADGVLALPLGELAAGERRSVRFRTRVGANAAGELPVKVLLTFDTPAASEQRSAPLESRLRRGSAPYGAASYTFTPRFEVLKAELADPDKRTLERIAGEWRGVRDLHLSAVGHSDRTPIVQRPKQPYADNYALSRARAQAVADFLAGALGLAPAQVAVEGRGADEPVASGGDAHSLALNRRVEIVITGSRLLADAPLELASDATAPLDSATRGVILKSASLPRARPARAVEPIGADAALDLEALHPGVAWLLPQENASPSIASLKVAIQCGPQQKVQLSVNGSRVSELNFDGVALNASGTVALSRWRGIALRDGDNLLVAVVNNPDGTEAQRFERHIHYGGGAVRAEFAAARSTLVADGKTHPVIVLKLYDAYGKPARRGTLGAYRVDPPYRSQWEVDALNENQLLAIGPREPTFEVTEDGIARLELAPTTQTGYVTLHLRFNERQQQDIRVWLDPGVRDWILVGVAEGTAAYHTLSQNMQAASDAGSVAGYENNGRVAFFAKGSIKGEYLLTMAYDSARDRAAAETRLNGVVQPDRYYTLYGDRTEMRNEAASVRKLYLKIERKQFVALFGDFDTGLTVTELARYSRTLNGFRTDIAGERAGLSAFAARSDQGLQRDELLGDGTSGLYHLSKHPLIVGSEKITLETRDRFRTEVVIESRELTRFIDYSVDYDTGTLFFKQPVPSRDANLNPNFIIIDYETLSGGAEHTTAGGRATVKLAQGRGELGASYLSEGAATGDTKLAGSDLRWHFTPATELRAELAQSRSDDPTRAASANAYLAELKHLTQTLDADVYLREQQVGFGVGQQLSTEAGTRKVGGDARWSVTKQWRLEGQTYQQEELATGAERNYVSGEVRYQQAGRTLGIGARDVVDRDASGLEQRSEQGFAAGSLDMWGNRVTLRLASDVSLSGSSDSIDYPSRSLLGIDYHVRADTTFFTEYEHAEGGNITADTTRIGVRARPWERLQIVSSMNQSFTEYGPRTFANLGLTQGWQANEHWMLDFGVDQSRTVRGTQALPFNASAPLASGSLTEDYFATFIGARYHTKLWTWASRAEHRNADSSDRWSLTSGLYREPQQGHAMSLSLQAFSTQSPHGLAAGPSSPLGNPSPDPSAAALPGAVIPASATSSAVGSGVASDISSAVLRFAWAYRPDESEWIVLDRIDLLYDRSRDAVNGLNEDWRVVNNLNTSWQLDSRTQLGLQYGARWVASTFDTERFTGYTDLMGLDLRRDLDARFDVGVHGTVMRSWTAHVVDESLGFDVGVTIARNVWVSVGYNFAGFHDADFGASRYLDQGPFLKLHIKADQDTFKDLRLDSLHAPR